MTTPVDRRPRPRRPARVRRPSAPSRSMPDEERDRDQAPLEFGLIRRIAGYTRPMPSNATRLR